MLTYKCRMALQFGLLLALLCNLSPPVGAQAKPDAMVVVPPKAMPSQAVYGVDQLYLFPYFQTRDDYTRFIGVEPPPFNADKPPKYWFDPAAAKSTSRTVVYQNVIAYDDDGKPIRDDAGNPLVDVLALPKADAASVNIPLKNAANEPGAGVPEVPPPLRALAADAAGNPIEQLFFGQFGVIQVKNLPLYATDPARDDGKFLRSDRQELQAMKALLQKVAKSLGVP